MLTKLKLMREWDIQTLVSEFTIDGLGDTTVDGKAITSAKQIPGYDGSHLKIAINVDTGQVVGWPTGISAFVAIHFSKYTSAIYDNLQHIIAAYALAIHGSVAKDFDLICVPQVPKPSPPEEVVEAIVREPTFNVLGEPAMQEHGRRVWTLVSEGFDHYYLDISFMPTL